ncbi:MAG TPA: amidohydrolase family protein, partial [Terriglobales bacterium]|nr:amidohydrolase family protein [Terriglobales bacterium]
ANDLCRAWNDWITEFCRENPARLKASALITLHDVDLAVEEVRRVAGLGVAGLSLCPEPVNGRRIHDRYYDPLWAEIEKLGVALCFHPPARPKQDQVANRLFGHPNASIVALALRNPVELIVAVSEFCAGGVLEKFPGLRVAFLEGNCAWLPWLLYRLDERAKLHGPLADVPLSKKPSDYFLRQCFISVDPDETLVTDVVARIGDDQLILSTDYPHIDAHFPHALDEFFKIELTEGSRKKILWDNCARLYGMV